MHRKTLIWILLAAMLVSLAGCGGSKGSGTEADSPSDGTPAPSPGATYASAYAQFESVCSALRAEVRNRVDANNALLESSYPDSYYMKSNYLMLDYVPFASIYPTLGSSLGRDDLSVALSAVQAVFPDAQLRETADGCWEAVYTYVDRSDGAPVDRQGRCVWECDAATGAFRVQAFVDGETVEFLEFVPQGNDLFLLYSMQDKALVRCSGGEVPALWHAHRISEPAMDNFAGDMRLCSLDKQDFYPNGTAPGVSWITDDVDARYVLTLENDAMIYSGRLRVDQTAADGTAVINWMDIDPITLIK